MKKKLLSAAIITAIMFGSTANAEVPPHSVIIGDKAYSIDYIVKPANFAEIDSQLNKSTSVYYVSSTRIIDLFTGKPISYSLISSFPQLSYKDGDGEKYTVLAGNGKLIHKTNPFMASANVSIGNGMTLFKNIKITTTLPDVCYYTIENGTSIQKIGQTIKCATDENYVKVKLLAYDKKTLIAEGQLDVSSSGYKVVSNLNFVLGNTPGNISNLGLVAKDRNWIYYRNSNEKGKLYRIKTDGVGKEEISSKENIEYINIVGEDLYFVSVGDEKNPTNIYRMDKRGLGVKSAIYQYSNDKEPINFGNIKDVMVAGNYVYYINDKTGFLYRFKTKYAGGRYVLDGKIQKVTKDMVEDVNMYKNYIYYVNVSDYNRIYRLNTITGENTRLTNFEAKHINIQGNWIYFRNYSDDEKLYKIKTDGTQYTKLSDDMAFNINVSGEWIYYKNASDNNFLYKIRTDGSGGKEEYITGQIISKSGYKISADRVGNINVIGDWIYFTKDKESRSITINKIRVDGNNRKQVD